VKRVLSEKFLATVGVCVKDAEETAGTMMKSILAQDLPQEQMEVLVVEGNSRDQTSSVIEKYLQESPVAYRVLRENSGLGMARQLVILNAFGRYIIWVDGDMVLPRHYIRKQIEFMEQHPEVGIAGGKYKAHFGYGAAADLENMKYYVCSVFGEKSASKFGALPGTEGSIYRVDAIRAIGGFDTMMDGAAEDTEIAFRTRASGWELAVTDESFMEVTRPTWSSLWKQYVWYGRGGHFVFHKNPEAISFWKMTPPAGFIAGVVYCPGAFLLTHKKIVFLLPFHYVFKRIAWTFGFMRAHIDNYGHSRKN